MDVFIEKIVARKKNAADVVVSILAVMGVFVLTFIALNIPVLNSLGLIIFVGLCYMAYRVISGRNIEYEYIVTNGDLDIDRIVSKRSRKRIFSANCKDFDIIAKVKSNHFTPQIQQIKNRIEAVSSLYEDDVYFITLNYKGDRMLVFFQPNEKMLNNFRTFIPRKIMN